LGDLGHSLPPFDIEKPVHRSGIYIVFKARPATAGLHVFASRLLGVSFELVFTQKYDFAPLTGEFVAVEVLYVPPKKGIE